MDDSPHASHWQQFAAAGEALAVTAAIAVAVLLLFDRASRAPPLVPSAASVAAVVPCDDAPHAAVRHVCLRAVPGGAPAAAPTRLTTGPAATVPGVDAR